MQAQVCCKVPIDLDGMQRSCALGQRRGEHGLARTDFDDYIVFGGRNCANYGIGRSGVTQEVLAKPLASP